MAGEATAGDIVAKVKELCHRQQFKGAVFLTAGAPGIEAHALFKIAEVVSNDAYRVEVVFKYKGLAFIADHFNSNKTPIIGRC